MRLLFASEHRTERTPDGRLWADSALRRALERYEATDTQLAILVRVTHAASSSPGTTCLNPDIVVHELPPYCGARGYLLSTLRVRRRARAAVESSDRVVVRVPGPIGFRVARETHAQGRPFSAEIVGDPWDVFAPQAGSRPLRRIIRLVARAQLRWLAAHGSVVCYVTAQHLQRRYPAGVNAKQFAISNVALVPGDFRCKPRIHPPQDPLRIATVASLNQPYKRVDLLLRLARLLGERSIPTRLVVIGDGALRPSLERLSFEIGVDCQFVGQISRRDVLRSFDVSDIYVSTSLVEGLPRATIEAMARGLPAFAFDAGGTAELRPGTSISPPADVHHMASSIGPLVHDPNRYRAHSEQSLLTAACYNLERLQPTTDALVAAVIGDGT